MVQKMTRAEKYDKMLTGLVSGFIFPIIVGLIIFVFTAHGESILKYLQRIADANIITHAITLCVFPNILIFLFFNRFDMLRASRGVLAITIAWAITVFIVKFV
jgi:hypothetical protein